MALGKTIFSLYTWWLPEVHPWPSAQNNHGFYWLTYTRNAASQGE